MVKRLPLPRLEQAPVEQDDSEDILLARGMLSQLLFRSEKNS